MVYNLSMISEISSLYKCSGSDNPSEAVFFCHEQGCEAYALMCGRSKCPCLLPHKKHSGKPIEGLLE